ncbi:MAG: hypothetical protein R2753_12810 [Chitinophagales bacterium]
MNKLALITTALILSLSVWAQGHHDKQERSPEEKAAYQKEYLTIVLDLNDEQVAQLGDLQKMYQKKAQVIKEKYQPILDEMKTKMQELKNNPEISEEKAKAIKDGYKEKLAPMHDAMKAQKKAFDKEFVEILNDAQGEKYLKLQALKESRKKEKDNGPRSLEFKKDKPVNKTAPTRSPSTK